MRIFFLCGFLTCVLFSSGQTTYTIDYIAEPLGSSCNVFGVNQTVDGFVHQSTKGFPNFVGNPDYYVNLPCKRNSVSSQVGTEYQILFPFKQNYKYQVNVYYRGTVASPSEFYPMITLALNSTKKAQVTSTSCTGPQSTSQTGLWFSGAAGPSFAWGSSLINSNALPQNYESLTIGSFPWPGSSVTGMQSIQIRQIQITEIPPPPPPVTITNNVISFATPFQYMEDISITGSTPDVSSGTYTYEWVVAPYSMGSPQTSTLNNFAISILQGSSVVNSSYTLQRKIISSTGVESLSNVLDMPKPTSNIVLSIAELPGNQKNGTKFIAGSAANFTISNPVSGVKYVWYYYHRYAPNNSAVTLVPTPAAGSNYSFTVGSYTGFPSGSPYYDILSVWGSDGS